MNAQIIGDFIKIPMENHALLIDTSEEGKDSIFIDGERVKTTSAEQYMTKYAKKVNLPHPKRRIATIQSRNFIWVLNIGIDGRIFLHKFTPEKYRTFRGKPEMTFSYWNCKSEKTKYFYDGDLTIPAFVRRYD